MRYFFLILIIILLFAFSISAYGVLSWRVFYDKAEVTALACPQTREGTVFLNLTSLGPMTGIIIKVEKEGIKITDSQDELYQASWGDIILKGKEKISLSFPLRLEKGDLFLEAAVVAKLAYRFLEFQEKEKILNFVLIRTEEEKVEVTVEEGLTAFTIKKAPEELKETKKRLGEFISEEEQTALEKKIGHSFIEHEQMRLDTSLGFYSAGGERKWGLEIAGSGKIYGGDVDLSFYLQEDDPYLQPGFLKWKSEMEGIGFEIGRLPSKIYGMEEAVRFVWKRKGSEFPQKNWSSLSLYFPDKELKDNLILAYGDEFNLSPNIYLQGEVSSEGSYTGGLSYDGTNLDLSVYGSWLEAQSTLKYGTSLGYDLGNNYFFGWSGKKENDEFSQRWIVKIPLLSTWELFLEGREHEYSQEKKDKIISLTNVFSLNNNLKGRFRYENITQEIFEEEGWVNYPSQRYIASLRYVLNPKLSLDYQIVATHNKGIDAQTRLRADYKISPKARIWVGTAFPEIFKKEDLKSIGFEYQLNSDWELEAQYQGFQQNNFYIKLCKSFSFDTPTRGGTIYGKTIDSLGNPISQIKIKAKNYQVITNEEGEYEIKGIPPGDYEVTIARETVPARYQAETVSQSISLKSGGKKEINFQLIPLSSFIGQIYEDRNKNGQYDPGEGIPGVVLGVDGRITASDSKGSYGFYNLPPGNYRIYLDLERLPDAYEVEGETEKYVDMVSYKPVTGIDFTLKTKKKEIIFQKIP